MDAPRKEPGVLMAVMNQIARFTQNTILQSLYSTFTKHLRAYWLFFRVLLSC